MYKRQVRAGAAAPKIATTVLAERRQVVAMVIRREVIEYRIVSGTCACRRAQRSAFPAGIEAPVPYGLSVSALAVYMTQYQLLPYQSSPRCSMSWPRISPDTLQRAVRVAAARLEGQPPRSRRTRRGASGLCR